MFLRYFFLFTTFILALEAQNLKIHAQELSNNLDSYTVLDARSLKLYKKNHIKGALNLPATTTYENSKINGHIVNPNKFQEIARRLGLSIKTPIVIYDDGSFFDSGRVFWVLETYGFKNLKILDLGFDNWVKEKYEISTKSPQPKSSNYIAKIDNTKFATKFATLIATKNPNEIIIDARRPQFYEGKRSIAKRYGHIPTAISIPSFSNLNKNHIKSLEELKKTYKNIDKNKKIIIYCSKGKVSSLTYFALRELGYKVANYDSSWQEWGSDLTLPIEK